MTHPDDVPDPRERMSPSVRRLENLVDELEGEEQWALADDVRRAIEALEREERRHQRDAG